MVFISQAWTEWNADTFDEQSSKRHVKAEFTETYPLAAWCPTILPFQTDMDATLLKYMCLGGGGGGGGGCCSPSGGFPVVYQCNLQVVAWSPNGVTVYTASPSGILVAFHCTLDHPVYTGSG